MKRVLSVMLVLSFVLLGSSCTQHELATRTVESAASATTAPSPTKSVAPSATASVVSAPSQESQSSSDVAAYDATFAALLERVKSSDPTIDYTEFRLAYAKTSQYDPYSFSIGDARKSMVTALNDKNYELALKFADEILVSNYIFPDAHAVAMSAQEGLGQSQEASFHRNVLNGLIDSILQSGDGTSPETAFQVVLIEEEYMVLSVLGVETRGQSEMEANGHSYDVLDGVVTKTNAATTLYFNIDIPFGALTDFFKP